MEFKINDIVKSKRNDMFHYKVLDIILWNNVQIMKLEPIDLKEPYRTGSYEPLIVVNDTFIQIFKIIKND